MSLSKFKLLAGRHIGPDFTQPPVENFNPNTGQMERKILRNPKTGWLSYQYPSRIFSQGEVFESNVDLVERFGADKFQLMGESDLSEEFPEQKGVSASARDTAVNFKEMTAAPNGQVISGFQQTSGGVPGPQPLDEARAESELPAPQTQTTTAAKVESLNAPPKQTAAPLAATTAAAATRQTPSPRVKREFSRTELEKKSKRELEELAEECEIDTEGCSTKEEIIKKFNPKK